MAGNHSTGYYFQSNTLRSGGSFMGTTPASQMSVFLNLSEASGQRLAKYQENWNTYFGKQWEFERTDGESLVVKNYTKLIADISSTWLTKNGFVNKPPDGFKRVGQFVDDVWDANHRQVLLNEAGQIGSVTGDLYLFVTVEVPKPGEALSEKHIRIFPKASQHCFPTVDPQDKTRLVSMRIESFYYDEIEAAAQPLNKDGSKPGVRIKRFTQVFTEKEIVETYEGQLPVVKPNLIGKIPVIHIQNLPVATDYFGMADIDGLIAMQRSMNEKSTDIEDIIAYHSAPLMVGYGFKASQVERTHRSFWTGLPVESKLDILNSNADLNNAMGYVAGLKNEMLELSETPKILLDNPGISNTSAVALSLTFQPIVNKVTHRKKPLYERGFTEVNELILLYGELFGLIHLPRDLCKNPKCGGKVLRVTDTGPFTRTINRCYLVDSNFVLATKEKARKIWNLGDEEEIETEKVSFSTVHIDPETGETQVLNDVSMELVPTDCEVSKPADPYHVCAEFLDALPRDEQVDADYWMKLLAVKLVSKAFVRRQTKRIDPAEIDQIERELKEEEAAEIEYEGKLAAARAGPQPAMPAAPGEVPGKKLPAQTPGEEELKRSTLPGGHNQKKEDPEGNEVKA